MVSRCYAAKKPGAPHFLACTACINHLLLMGATADIISSLPDLARLLKRNQFFSQRPSK